MSSVSITNTSIDPAALPYPFSGVLGGLGSVIYAGTPADVLELVPSMQEGFRLTEIPTVAGAPTLPEFPTGAVTDNAVEIIVGNELNGATISGCTYLDPGDGSGIAAALAYAADNSSQMFIVRIGPGEYTLVEATALLTVPSNCRVVGAGSGLVSIVGTAITDVANGVFDLAGGAWLSGVSVTSPEPGLAAASDAIVVLGGFNRLEDVRVVIQATTDASPTSVGISYFSGDASPDGIELTDCAVNFVGTDVGAYGAGAIGIRIGSDSIPITAPTRRSYCTRCTVSGDGGTASVTGFSIDCTVDLYDCITKKLVGTGVTLNGVATTALVGPRIQNLLCDVRGIPAASATIGVLMAVSGVGCVIVDSDIDIRFVADSNLSASGRAFMMFGDTGTLSNTCLRVLAQLVTAGSGGIEILAENTAVSGLAIQALLGAIGDIAFAASAGVISKTKITASNCRNLSIGATMAYTQLSDVVVSTALTLAAGASNTVIDKSCNVGAITDSTTASQGTVYGWGKTRTMNGSDGLYFSDDTILCNLVGGSSLQLPSPASSMVKGKVFTIRDIGGNFSTRNLTVTRAGSENINGAGANLVLAVNGGTTRIMSDGTNWWTLGLETP